MFKFGHNSLAIVLKYKYLGIILDEHLTYNECATTLADSAGRALGSVISKFYSFKNIGYSTFSKLYDTTVWPILDYCSSIWSFKKHNYAAKVQDRAARYFLGVHKNAPSLAVQGKIGWILPEFKYYVSMLRLWNKLISLDPTRITHVIFEWDHQNFNPDSWSGKIWNVFELLNLSDTFLNGTEVNILQAKRKLNMIMHQTWCEKLPFKPKLRTYILIKNSLEPESFVTGF